MRKYLTLLLFILFTSCGGRDPTRTAVFQADYYLTSGKCSKAQEVLDDAGWSSSARYIGAYSNVYACYAGFSELSALFEGNLDQLQTSSADAIFQSLASFDTSNETAPDSSVYSNINLGIRTILDAVGTIPSAALRNSEYGSRAGTDLNSQALYMVIFQFGKFLRLYGNTDSTGVKGSGPHGSECFMDYPNTGPLINGSTTTGSCNAAAEGSPYLDFVTDPEDATRRACEGVIYFNNLMDILRNLDFGDSDISVQLQDLVDTIDAYLASLASDADLDPYIDLTSQSGCEDEVSGNKVGLEKFYIAVFEVLLQ